MKTSHRWSRIQIHPPEEALFRGFEATLPPRELARVRQHLEHCWECQTKLERWERARSSYIAFKYDFDESVSAAPASWSSFRDRLHDLAEELGSSPRQSFWLTLRMRIAKAVSAMRYPLAAPALLAAVVVIAAVFLVPTRPVRAAQLLAQSHSSDLAIRALPGRYSYRVVTVEQRMPGTGQVRMRRRLETWEKGASSASARRLFADNGQLVAGAWRKSDGSCVLLDKGKISHPLFYAPELQNAILSQELLLQLSPSADVFLQLTPSSSQMRVQESQESYVLSFAGNGSANGQQPRLLSASLTLRRSNLHPVEQDLVVEDAGQVSDYHYVEVSFEQQSETPALAQMLEVDPAVLGDVSPPPPRPEVLVTPAIVTDAMQRLDSVDAFTREQLTLRKAAGSLVVEGVVETVQRKREIMSALGELSANPAIEVKLLTPEEAEKQQLTSRRTPQLRLNTVNVDLARLPAGASLELRSYFSQKAYSGTQLEVRISEFVDESISHSTKAGLQLQALEEILEALPESQSASLRPEVRKSRNELMTRHLDEFRVEIEALHRQLEPVYGTHDKPAEESRSGSDESLAGILSRLGELSKRVDKAVWTSFSLSEDKEASASLSSTEFWQSMHEIENLAAVAANKL